MQHSAVHHGRHNTAQCTAVQYSTGVRRTWTKGAVSDQTRERRIGEERREEERGVENRKEEDWTETLGDETAVSGTLLRSHYIVHNTDTE